MLGVNSIQFDELASDPGTPLEGQVWYNSTTDQLKVFRNGSTVILIDSVVFNTHASRHAPGGADALATGTPVDITDSTNAEGAGTTLARNNHTHAHGTRGGGTLHALTALTAAGFQPQSNRTATTNPTVNEDSGDGYAVGSYWINTTADTLWFCVDATVAAAVWITLPTGLATKSGTVANATFAGTPMQATVTFSAAFGSANYSVVLSPVTTNDKTFAPVVESKLAGSFVINIGTNSKTDLTEVLWTAVAHGETT